MSDDAQEKQFNPSLKRLEELKKKGNFLRSRDLSSGMILIVSIAMILVMTGNIYRIFSKNFIEIFTAFEHTDDFESLPVIYKNIAFDNALLILPLMAVLFLIPFLFTYLFGGFGISMSLVKLKLERLSPMKNLKKIFSVNNLMEIAKSIFKFSLLLFIFIIFLFLNNHKITDLTRSHNENQLFQGMAVIYTYLLFIVIGLVIIIIVDVLYTYVTHQKKIKMSFQELKDENKETDGNPENKRRIRMAQLAMKRQRIQQDVPSATVIITNPTHYSVALKYEEKTDGAPRIIAAGIDNIAAEIKLIGIKHAVPIYEAPELARAIYYTGKVGGYIHPELYTAVAIVLTYIAQLKKHQMGAGERPSSVPDLKIPKEFHFDR